MNCSGTNPYASLFGWTAEEFDIAAEAIRAYRVEKEREVKKNELIQNGNEILRQLKNLGYTPNVSQLVCHES